MGDRAVGYFAVFAIGLLGGMSLPTAEPKVFFLAKRWAPLTQWTCDDQESRERAFACGHREHMDVILRATRPAKGRG